MSQPPHNLPEQDPSRPQRVVRVVRSSAEPAHTPPPESSGRSGCFYTTVGCLGIVVIVMIAFVALVLLGITSIGNITAGFESMFVSSAPPQARVTSSRTIVTNIQAMGQLVSISAEMAKADIDVQIQQGLLGATSFTTKHVAEGTISAGIDLTAITPEDVQYDRLSNTYTIMLPPPGLTSCDIGYIRQYDYSGTIFQVDRDEARLIAEYTALSTFRDEAIESGILDRAEQQARIVFTNLVETITGSNVNVNFMATAVDLPTTCQPTIPGNWTYDPTTQTWTQPE